MPAGYPKGDVPALGRLTVNEAQGADQWWVVWGGETNDDYTHTDSTGPGALFYEAESRTPLGGSATAVGPSGASGGGSNVIRNTALGGDYSAVLSTQASGGGAHLSHVGTFRVFGRVQTPTTNTGTVSVALEWAVGDFRRPTRNDPVIMDPYWEGSWRLLELGLVAIPKVLTGSQVWEGRILAKSTVAGDDIDIDYIILVPVSIAAGEVRALPTIPAPTSFTGRDEFDQTAGALAGKTAAVGGNWAGAGDADDFSVETTGHTAQRTSVTDTSNIGRYALLGSAIANTAAQADIKFSSNLRGAGVYLGMIARYADTNNHAQALMHGNPAVDGYKVLVRKRVAGTFTTLGEVVIPDLAVDVFYTMRFTVSATGQWRVWVWAAGGLAGSPVITGQDSALATGGALASGQGGIYDENTNGTMTRTFDNVMIFSPAIDAAMFASQSLEIRHDGVQREDSAGAIWQPVSSYTGDLLRVPPTGREGRSIRFIVKACRNDPVVGPDAAIDDINATLAVTPRYLSVPAPA